MSTFCLLLSNAWFSFAYEFSYLPNFRSHCHHSNLFKVDPAPGDVHRASSRRGLQRLSLCPPHSTCCHGRRCITSRRPVDSFDEADAQLSPYLCPAHPEAHLLTSCIPTPCASSPRTRTGLKEPAAIFVIVLPQAQATGSPDLINSGGLTRQCSCLSEDSTSHSTLQVQSFM